MIIKETMQGDAGMLVDEQEKSGDPANNSGGAPSKKWETGWSEMYFPANAIIDLGVEHHLTAIYFFDTFDHGSVTVFTGTPFQWQEQFNDKLENYHKWNAHPINARTRYIRISVSNHIAPVEVIVYGSSTGAMKTPEPVLLAHQQPTIDQFIGTNAFIDDPIDKIKVAGVVREYHNWNWDEGNEKYGAESTYPGFPNNQNTWNPSVENWNFDNYYSKLKKEGIIVSPVVKGSVNWISKKYGTKPIDKGENPEDPSSYTEHADHLFQYVARFGKVVHADEKLKLAPGQPRVSGLNTLQYIENWNEQDAWWAGKEPYFSPYEYAAMASADYDGHQGKLGKTLGVKNADPDFKMVMGGIARLDLDYIKAIKFWADYHRNGNFPADVINVHHYSNDGEDQAKGNIGISPEEENLKEKLKEIVDYRNKYLPGKEVWITEFGYDTHPKSPQRAPSIGDYSTKEVQAQWLVRSFLELAAAGVDRACMYMLRDVDSTSSVKFNTSGLVSNHGVWYPKPSWYYVYTLKNTFAGMRFSKEVSSGNENIRIYEFRHSKNNKKGYAIWCPTSDGIIVDNYVFTLPEKSKSAVMVKMKAGNIYGAKSYLIVKNNKVTINVSERPVFVVVD
ncbi:MAG TPA: hypothetical protein VD908_03720 [Cytophagales bacterium]|nr:hypothetical protein [Cytophagales bacterium]